MEGISSSNLQPAVPDLAESCALNEQKEDKNEGGLERSTNNPALDIKGNTANTRYASQVDVRKNDEESWKQPRDNNDLSATSEDMMVDSVSIKTTYFLILGCMAIRKLPQLHNILYFIAAEDKYIKSLKGVCI